MAKIMIVDDSPDNRDMLHDVLDVIGHKVISELDESVHAVNEFFRLRPEVLFLDIAMPRIDGFTILAEIKQKCPSAKIVIVSATDSENFIEKCYNSGASGFVSKPYEISDIEHCISELLSRES